MASYFNDRIVQYPGRVTMTPTGTSDTYDITRAEGTVTNEGSPFNAETFNGAIDLYAMFYGTCSTAGGTSAKVVVCSGFTLVTGATIAVNFSNAQTSTSACTLNVNSTGAKTIYGIARSTTSTTRIDGAWEAGETKVFTYDGTYWRLVDQNIITSSELSSLETSLGL